MKTSLVRASVDEYDYGINISFVWKGYGVSITEPRITCCSWLHAAFSSKLVAIVNDKKF